MLAYVSSEMHAQQKAKMELKNLSKAVGTSSLLVYFFELSSVLRAAGLELSSPTQRQVASAGYMARDGETCG